MDDGAIDQSSVINGPTKEEGVRRRRRRFQILSNQGVV
jgi:hypothetical protein